MALPNPEPATATYGRARAGRAARDRHAATARLPRRYRQKTGFVKTSGNRDLPPLQALVRPTDLQSGGYWLGRFRARLR